MPFPLLAALAWSAPLIPVQGELRDSDGGLMVGTHAVTVTLYDAASGGSARHTETQPVAFEAGGFAAVLGRSPAFSDTFFRDNPSLWLSIAVDGGPASERVPVASAPFASFAAYAGDARSVSGAVLGDLWQKTETIPWDKVAVPGPFADGTDDGNTYTAGAGLGLSGGAFSVGAGAGVSVSGGTVNVNFGGTGSANSAARSDHTHGNLLTADGANTLSQALTLANSAPSAPLHAASKGYVDGNFGGLRMTSLVVRGSGLNQATGSQDRNILVSGADQAGNSRGLHLTVIDRATHAVIDNKTWDTHGASADVTAMTTYLNALDTSRIVAIASYDAWLSLVTPELKLALARCGASQAVLNVPSAPATTYSRTAYALVGICGLGVGSGIERSLDSALGPAELSTWITGTDVLGMSGNATAIPGSWSVTASSGFVYNGTWNDIPNTTLVVPIARRSMVNLKFSIGLSAYTNNNHCGTRFVVNSVARGDPSHGNMIVMGQPGTHWQTLARDMYEEWQPGVYTVKLQGRANDGGSCSLDGNNEYSRAALSVTAYPF